MREKVSVVIPTYNGLHHLQRHIPQVITILEKGDEVVIVDDAGTDNTPDWITKQAALHQKNGVELKYVRHETNQRFAAAVNTGVLSAKNPFIFLLNNDVSPVTKNSIELLLRWFEDSNTFAIGCAEITQLKPNAKVSGRGTGNWARGLAIHWYDPNQSLSNTLWTSGGSMFFEKKKFQTLGGFDTLYSPAYEEDRDLSFRALKHDWSVYFDPEVIVLHQHESTNSTVFGQRRINDISWKNQYLFVWKNITSPALIFSHILWLPYHLSVSAMRSQGSALRGFLLALKQLPAALAQRKKMQTLWKRRDQEVFYSAQTQKHSPFSPRH